MKRSVLFLAGVLLAFGLLFTGCPTSGGDNGPKESRVIYEKSFATFELKTDDYSEGNIQNQLATDGISEKIVKGKRVLVLFEGTPDKDLNGLYVQLADGTAEAGHWGALTEETPWDIDDLDEPEGDDEYVSEIELTAGEKFEGRLVLNTVGTSTANTGAANKFAIKVYGSENDKGEPGFGSEKLTFSDVKLAIVVLEGDDDGSTFTLGDTPPAADEPIVIIQQTMDSFELKADANSEGDIQHIFKADKVEKSIKKGKELEVTVTGTPDANFAKLYLTFADNTESAGWWKELSGEVLLLEEGKNGEEFSATQKVTASESSTVASGGANAMNFKIKKEDNTDFTDETTVTFSNFSVKVTLLGAEIE